MIQAANANLLQAAEALLVDYLTAVPAKNQRKGVVEDLRRAIAQAKGMAQTA